MREEPVTLAETLLEPETPQQMHDFVGDNETSRPSGGVDYSRNSLLLDSGDGVEQSYAPQHVRLQRTPVWGATVNTVAFMAVPRSVPACFAATGWPLGILSLAYSSVVTYDTGQLIGRICNSLPAHRCSYPGISAAAAQRTAERYGGSSRAQARAESAARVVVACLQYTSYYLTGVAELIYFEQFCGQLFQASPLCQWQWLLIVGLLALPVLQIPSFHASRYAALVLGVMPLILNVSVMLYEIAAVRPWDCEPGPTYTAWPTPSRAAVGFTAFAYAFGGHGLYPEQIREMSQPSLWPRVMSYTYAVAVPLYWLCGLLGYYAYGDFSLANINLNFPDNAANRLSIAVQAFQELFFVLDSDLVVMLALELHLGLDPSTCCSPGWRGCSPWIGRLALRTLFLASQIFCAQMLLSGEGDTLLSLQGLCAAVGMVAFTYFLPYAIYAVLSPEPLSRGRKVWGACNIGVGVAVMIAGFGSSLSELIDGAGGVFSGVCEIQYAYAPHSPNDPCNISGIPPWAH
jgi:proton-coupled amino acid transporter